MRVFTSLLFSVCSVLPAVQALPVSAQQQDSALALPDLVITATRTPMPREAITSSVTVLQGAVLRASGLTTVADALRDLPEAAVVRTGAPGGQTTLFLRGGESNFTQVLVDGVPVNEPGGAFDFATLTLDNVERIEIVRGPASVLYGSDAVSGVVHVITAGGQEDRTAGDLSVRYGTYETLDVSTRILGRAGPATWSVTGARHASAGLYPFNNDFENLVAGARLGLRFGGTSLDLTSRYADGTYHFPTDGTGALVDSNQYQGAETLTLGLEAGQRVSSRLEARIQLGFNRLDGGTDDQPDFVGDGLSRSTRWQVRRSADARLNVRASGMLITVGSTVEGEHERTSFESVSSFGPFSSSFDETRRNLAAYSQVTGQMGGLAVSAGGRVDDNQQFGTFVTGRGGLAYRLATGTRVRATIGNGFKAPTFFEQFGSDFVEGNPALEPEQSFSWELGAEQPLADGRVRLEATWFQQRFTDLIEYVGAPAAGEPNYVNVAGASADGLELSADVRLPSPVSRLTIAYTRLLTEVTAAGEDPTFAPGQELVRRPGHAFTARVTAAPVPTLSVGAGVRYTGVRTDLDYSVVDFVAVTEPARVQLGAYTLFDLSAGWQVIRGVRLDASVENLFDTGYAQVIGFATPGRKVTVGGTLSM